MYLILTALIVNSHRPELIQMYIGYFRLLPQFSINIIFYILIKQAKYLIFINCHYTVFDSWGKLPSGILDGNVYSFGNFDECLSVQRPPSSADGLSEFQTQYCLAEVYTQTPDIDRSRILANPIQMKGMDARMIAQSNQHPNQT